MNEKVTEEHLAMTYHYLSGNAANIDCKMGESSYEEKRGLTKIYEDVRYWVSKVTWEMQYLRGQSSRGPVASSSLPK